MNGGGGLVYASRNPNGTYAIETAAPSVLEVSLVLDSTGSPHVSYYDTVAQSIAYAHRTSPGWEIENVDSSDGTFHSNRIRLDASDRPHLCYEKIGTDLYSILGYATRSAAGVWTKGGPSFPKDNPGGYCAIALDRQGQPHISHATGLSTLYSYLQGGTWVNMTVDVYGASGGYTSIALDLSDKPSISYYDFAQHQLRYARQK